MVTAGMLTKIDLFENLPQASLEVLASSCERVQCAPGEVLFREGERAHKLYVLEKGKVVIRLQLTSRPETITVAVLSKPHTSFGWSSVVAPFFYTAAAVCEVESELISVDARALMGILEREPEVGYIIMKRITKIISSRLRNSRGALLRTL
jgi:CRP-like cAMP-binding protein